MSVRLIRPATLAHVKQMLCDTRTQPQIINLLERHGFDQRDRPDISSKLKRTDPFFDHQDWTDPGVVKRLVDAVEEVLLVPSEPDEYSPDTVTRMLTALAADGFQWTGKTFLGPCSAAIMSGLDALQRFGLDSLQREIERALENIVKDPADSLTASKCALESTCKAVQTAHGETPDPKDDMGALLKATIRLLKLLPEDVSDSKSGAAALKRITGGVGSTIQGLTELRNLYGDPHGKPPGHRGIEARHARLALTLAAGMATFLLETDETN